MVVVIPLLPDDYLSLKMQTCIKNSFDNDVVYIVNDFYLFSVGILVALKVSDSFGRLLTNWNESRDKYKNECLWGRENPLFVKNS